MKPRESEPYKVPQCYQWLEKIEPVLAYSWDTSQCNQHNLQSTLDIVFSMKDYEEN